MQPSDMEFGTNLGSNVEHREGSVTRKIEEQTAKIPSDFFLWAAGASIVASLVAQIVGMARPGKDLLFKSRAPIATFIGMWVPSLLMLGVYNKIVKVAGSDRFSR